MLSNVNNIAGTSTYPVSAIEVNKRREGVCRDLAQISNGLRIAIAHGRDSTDVAIYNQYGPLLLPNAITVTVDTV